MSMNRKYFLKITGIAGLVFCMSCNEAFHGKYQIENPYQNVDWEKVNYIPSTSHIHITNQQGLDRAYELGYRHLPVSNYYPSAPYYPINRIRENQFRVKQDFGVMRLPQNGAPTYVEGPIEWNKVIMDKETGWYESLSEERQKEFPFEIGDLIFKNIPEDIIFSPNAEHHAFTNISGNVHICAPGSLYSSGTFDARNNFKTFWGGGDFSYGTGLTWQEAFREIFDQLLFDDGGGITINHPTWTNENDKSNLPQFLIEEMLDFDPRVLGIEIYSTTDWDLKLWDEILTTGRRCLGFLVPDWGVQVNDFQGGFNILLTDDYTEYNCLKAYRDGVFFGSQFGSRDIIFKKISLKKEQLIIEVNSKSNITFITDKDISKNDGVSHAKFTIPFDVNNVPTIKYIRVEAENGNERIFSQPIRFITG